MQTDGMLKSLFFFLQRVLCTQCINYQFLKKSLCLYFYRDISNYRTLAFVQAWRNLIEQTTTKISKMPKLEISVSRVSMLVCWRWNRKLEFDPLKFVMYTIFWMTFCQYIFLAEEICYIYDLQFELFTKYHLYTAV